MLRRFELSGQTKWNFANLYPFLAEEEPLLADLAYLQMFEVILSEFMRFFSPFRFAPRVAISLVKVSAFILYLVRISRFDVV